MSHSANRSSMFSHCAQNIVREPLVALPHIGSELLRVQPCFPFLYTYPKLIKLIVETYHESTWLIGCRSALPSYAQLRFLFRKCCRCRRNHVATLLLGLAHVARVDMSHAQCCPPRRFNPAKGTAIMHGTYMNTTLLRNLFAFVCSRVSPS